MAGLLFLARAQMAAAAGLRRQHGLGFFEARRLASTVDASTIALATSMLPAEADREVVGAIGDGTILQAIIDFFNSDLGKALVQLIISLLIGV